MTYDIITFGSGTRDVYLVGKNFKIVEEKKFFGGKGIAVSLGSKIEIDNIMFHTGGGATNAAVTFKKQGFKVSWCGMVGKDIGGSEILRQLKDLGIDTKFVFRTDKAPTNYSVILSSPQAPDKERTILVYRGASSELSSNMIPWSKLAADWFYLAPLSGKLAKLFPQLVNYGKTNGIKIAMNPGATQLNMKDDALKSILPKADALFLNQEEAVLAARMPYRSDRGILKKLSNMCGGVIVVTKGPLGAVATEGKRMFTIPIIKTKVVDRTGAGDSFCSGFLSEFIRTKNIEKSLQFGMANSAVNIAKWGAKEDLLERGEKFKKMPVAVSALR
ncbi:MAG: hypothetical protein A3D59_03735 [Candidatus Wildermuthbacteria bacterium RIFCSPHIGHO2_02_FULL_47_17]|uniref:Carbohydrate kinase PfkB domain-containing protein n=1 Tax=Candidatus Wildermuthbacteria bacterium RIFCSPHIGHO2_02_FULL_47_17 TaxID=1802452 RepID=A0A1G2R472_9BACT|nr:MAG: hypothetical protein A3D59_03735 [Candidatus Wildermuthbacteria bacterium RIFCSPHIGHO2_02_FULL_47_17]